ncbi:DNA-3-methyladenine glycosylase [Cyanobium sp. FGCU-6]|nr:DNA-3-methyladenine glycosylase [Cyanobium sp. FGCU6]
MPGTAMASNGVVLPPEHFARPAELVAPGLIGCQLVRRLADGSLRRGVIVETEAYCQSEPGCHGHRRRTPGNETLFGEPGRFYVYVSYGIHHCVNVVTDRAEWASGVLLRAAALPGAPERIAAGPALLARAFAIGGDHDDRPAEPAHGLWLEAPPPPVAALLAREGPAAIFRTTRIGLSRGQDLPWRWYLRGSRSVSRSAPGDRRPRVDRLAPWLADGAPASTVG